MGNNKLKIQSLVFEKNIFSNRSSVKNWVLSRGFNIDNRLRKPIMDFDKTYRVRQRNPDWFNKKTFKLRSLGKGVKGVFGKIKSRR